MTPQFHERYISRAEHNSIVAYYKKLVIQLYQRRQTTIAGDDLAHIPTSVSHDENPVAHDCWAELGDVDFGGSGGKVIRFDFTRRSVIDPKLNG